MAVYTIELGRLLDTKFPLGLDDYPTPAFCKTESERKTWRDALNAKIISHYYYDEICAVPPDRFKRLLNNTMREIMPRFVRLYDALDEEWTFYTGTGITEIINDSNSGSSTESNTRSTKYSGSDKDTSIRSDHDSTDNYTLTVASDTPGNILNVNNSIQSNMYASAAQKVDTDTSTTSTSTVNNTTEYVRNESHTNTRNANETSAGKRERKVTGLNSKSYAELYKQYADSINNLDHEVIMSLQSCFMGIF